MLSTGKRSRLPPEYQEVEYLTNPYGGYIDTGMQIVNGDIIHLSFLTSSVLATSDYAFYGWRREASWRTIKQVYIGSYSAQTRCIAIGIGAIGGAKQYNFDTKNNIIINSDAKTVYINGELATFPFSFEEDTLFDENGVSEFNPCIFALNVMGRASALDKASQFFGYAVSSYDGVSKSNLITCYRRIDSKPGVFDLARNLFITSANSHDFVCGPNVN